MSDSVFDNEKRRFKRFPGNVGIRFRKLDLSGAQKEQKSFSTYTAKASNVSEMGVFINTHDLLPPESVLEIIFIFEAQNREVKALARVTWISHEAGQEGMGVEIFKVNEDLYSNIILRAKRGNWVDVPRDEPPGQKI